MKTKFLHISDLHFLRRYPAAEQGYPAIFGKMTPPLVQLERCLEKAAGMEPEFILLTGDLTEDGNEEDYRWLKAWIDEKLAKIPLIVTLGNHDNRPAFYRGWLEREESTRPYNQVVDMGEFAVVSFDNSAPGCPDGIVTAEQLDWLTRTLECLAAKPVILMAHHHLNRDQSDMPTAEYPEAFRKLIADSSVAGIFGGHTHHHYQGTFGGKPYSTCGSLSFAGEARDNGTVIFREISSGNFVEINGAEISCTMIPICQEGKILQKIEI